jgi:hypothetical protein
MFLRRIDLEPKKRPVIIRQKPIIIVKKGITSDGYPFKQTITESGQKYLHQGKPSGFSISKDMSYVSGPNMKIKSIPTKKGVKHLTLKNMIEHLMHKKIAKKPATKKKVAKKPVAKTKVVKKPAAKKKVAKKVVKKPVAKKKVVKKKVAKKPVVHKKGFAYKKNPSKKEYIVVSGKKRLIHKGNRGAEYYKLNGKKHYIPSIK